MSAASSSTRRLPASRLRTVPPVYSLRRERNTKRRGELAELVFLLIATRMGFAVSKPYGDNERYDFVLDARLAHPRFQSASLLWRIQVKASTQLLNGLYRVNAHRRTGGRAVPYRIGEIDFIAAYIIPEDTWYILPLRAVRGTSLLIRPRKDRRPGRYDQYREAWHLLRPKV
jgi:PD-(D/E)XK endonuclease